jgi:tRNA nucleotidyltransferase/poly(A) polymerase
LVVLIDKQWEHTTFRTESNCDGVRANVLASESLEEDAFRRDFTINAIYIDILTGTIIDPVGGLKDIEAKVLRLISSERYGASIDRLYEHGGRLFRLSRFTIKLEGWEVSEETITACKEFSPHVFKYGNVEAFITEWEKCDYNWKYLLFLDKVDFLSTHDLVLPDQYEDNSKAWYYLWEASKKKNPDLTIKVFQKQWKFPNEVKDICIDLDNGKDLIEDWQWATTKFKRLTTEEVVLHWNKSFIRLEGLPTQGEIAMEIGAGPKVREVWVNRIKKIYQEKKC